jgi:mono/diheme cytochrome c family protein
VHDYRIGVFIFVVCALVSGGLKAADRPEAGRASSESIERGRYLVLITGCNDCHTPNYLNNGGKTPETDRLVGAKLGWRGPWGTAYATNLRLYFNELTEEQWVEIASEIQRKPPMPYYSLNAMKQADLEAIYRYIRFLGPAGNPAPPFVPPGREPPKPYVILPGDPN